MDKRLFEVLSGLEDNYFLPFFWQHGEDEAVLREEMQKIHEAGMGAVCVESRPHPDFAGPLWWRDLDIIMDEARRRSMRVWVLDDAHFPTGFANGAIRDRFPDKGKRYLMCKTIDADGLGPRCFFVDSWLNRFDWMHPDEKLFMDDELFAAVAFRRLGDDSGTDGTPLDLTELIRGGTLYWDMPEGAWRIFLVIITRNWGGDPDYINIIDADSVKVLIDAVYEPHYEHYKQDFGGAFAGFFSDEPGFGNTRGFQFDELIGRKQMVLPWSNELDQLLERDIGADYRLLLPCLWFPAGERAREMRYKYMDLVTSLYEKNFSGQLEQWCAARGVEYIGHVIEDQNVHARLGAGAGHFFRAQDGQHMAGIDIIGRQVMPRQVGYCGQVDSAEQDYEFFHFGLAKLASSLGHIDPKKHGRALCEIFGASGWAAGLKFYKWLIDHALVRGVNYFVPHAFSPKEFPDPDCPPHFYARGYNPQYPYLHILTRYTDRLCHLLIDGTHVAPAAILYHAELEWSGNCMFFQKPAHVLSDNQIDFDILPLDALVKPEKYGTVFIDGTLHVNRENYRCLIVPACERILPEVAKGIQIAADAGVPVFFIGAQPTAPSLRDCSVVALGCLADVLRQRGIFDILLSTPQPYLRYFHVCHEQTDVYMFFNEHPSQAIFTTVQFRQSPPVYRYDAFTNTVTPLRLQDSQFELSLEAYESTVVLFGAVDPELLSKPAPTLVMHRQNLEVDGRLSFDRTEDAFEVNFSFDGGAYDAAVLNLGEVYEIAQVWVNGYCASTRICPPYRFDVGSFLQNGENHLRIEVTGTLAYKIQDPFSAVAAVEPVGLRGPISLTTYVYEEQINVD